MSAHQLPEHLQKYIVSQDQAKYTSLEHATWRYILRQLRSFLEVHAHPDYLSGLERTGISVDEIPSIKNISAALSKFGWSALPVSGFIPPAAFMELQSLGVLPIASEMRTFETLGYTPAPDIVHEAAGHAPMLSVREFSEYLKQYAKVANRAIISSEDLAIYSAIRELSDLKEHPHSTPEQIQNAEEKLLSLTKACSHISEAALLARMNWWTAEYGLIGEIENPKIFGAGLFSSIGESKWCLDKKVQKRPLTIDCVETGYDITEPQPQLFVTPNFEALGKVLGEFANKMAFRRGGMESLEKAIQAKTITTTQLDSGLQISGVLQSATLLETTEGKSFYLQFTGPCQLSFNDKEIPEHGISVHSQGFGSPVGRFRSNIDQCPSTFDDFQLQSLGFMPGHRISFQMTGGVSINGVYLGKVRKDGRLLVLRFEDCTVTGAKGQIFFDPSWGSYDMAVGCDVVSVFGGAADRDRFPQDNDFSPHHVRPREPTKTEIQLFHFFDRTKQIRESQQESLAIESEVSALLQDLEKHKVDNWLLWLEVYEICQSRKVTQTQKAFERLKEISLQRPDWKAFIDDGLRLAQQA